MPNVVNNYLNENNACKKKLCIYIMKFTIKVIKVEESVADSEQTFCHVVLLWTQQGMGGLAWLSW